MTPAQETALAALRLAVDDLEHEEPTPGTVVVLLPGEKKLKTTVSLVVGAHSLSVNAFVVRHPDENHDSVHRWLLERNTRLYAVAYAVDRLGDIYLTGRLPLHAITVVEVDRVLGQVLEASDTSFNVLLEMGFATAIGKEWAWRLSRGEPTDNLAAFPRLAPSPTSPDLAPAPRDPPPDEPESPGSDG